MSAGQPEVGGQDLQGDPAVLEQGDLPGLPVVLDLHGLLGPGDLPGPAAVGDGGDDRQHDRDGQRCPPVGDPVHVLGAAVGEDLRVGAAAVEAEHDLRAGPGGPLQLSQRFGQREAEPGRFPGHEAHRPPVMGGDMGIGAAPLGAAPLVVPPFRDRPGPGIGHEVVIDVVDAGGHRVRGQHRGREHRLHRDRVGPVGDPGQVRPQRPQPRQHPEPGQRPRVGRGQVLELLDRVRAQREAHADRRQQRQIRRPPVTGCGQRAVRAARAKNACSSIAPAYRDASTPPPAAASPAAPARRQAASTSTSTSTRLGQDSLSLSLSLSRRPGLSLGLGLGLGRRAGEQGLRRGVLPAPAA